MSSEFDISVIIPMYNSEKFIEETVASITTQQTHGLTVEIIIVDDASSDHSREVVKNLKNQNIRLIELGKNGGTAHARNTGIRLAQGEWIQFVDSDDRICTDLYKKFEESFKPGFNCYVFSLILDGYDYTLKQTITDVKDKRAFGHFGSVCNKFIKRDICIKFRKEYSFEDNIFILDMMIEKNLKIALIKDAYYLYNCKNDQSKMSNFNRVEFQKMTSYVYNKIDVCDDFTKMYILEIFVALLLNRNRPFFNSLKIATKTLLKLNKYLPRVLINQNRHFIKNTKIR